MPESVRVTKSDPASGSFALIHDSVPQGSLLFAIDNPTDLQSQAHLLYEGPLPLVTLGEEMRMRRDYQISHPILEDLSPDIFTPYVAGQESPNDLSPPNAEAEVAEDSPADSVQMSSPQSGSSLRP